MGNPWKAFQPYDEGSAANFKGREENIQELLTIIFQSQISVCYAESGIGKSSLINAGLKPILRQRNYLPVDVKFTEQKLNEKDFDFDGFVINRLKEEISRQNSCNKTLHLELRAIDETELIDVDEELSTKSLWWILHTRKIECHIMGVKTMDFIPIFILDQFEEIFNSNVNEAFVQKFFSWFQESTSSCMPAHIEQKIKGCDADLNLPDNAPYKFLLSLRQDAMGSLDYWITQRLSIPSLRQNHYCLTPLTREQAKRVITEQGVDTLNLVADEIINELIEKNADAVPSILLSVFCSRLYDKAVAKDDGTKVQVKKEDVSANKKTLIREFYEYLLANTKIKEKHVRIIEDCLVSKSTGKRKRIESNHPRLEAIGFNRLYKESLLKAYLISHTTIEGTEYIEISHDKVAEAISARQKERKLKKNLNSWRFLLFIVPLFLLVASYAYLLMPRKDFINDYAHFKLMRHDIPDREYVKVHASCLELGYPIRNALCDNSYITISDNFAVNKVIIEEDSAESELFVRFQNCPNLSEIRFSKNISKIDRESSFVDCDDLTIHIHQGIRYINPKAFSSGNLDFNIDSDNKNFVWQDGILWDLSGSEHPVLYVRDEILKEDISVPFVSRYSHLDSVNYNGKNINRFKDDDLQIVANDGVLVQSDSYRFVEFIDLSTHPEIKVIDAKAFKDCSRLTEIVLPCELEIIGEQAFAECVNLKSIVFPATLKKIGDYAFANCVKLDSISFSARSMDTIGQYAFANCEALEYLRLPSEKIDRIEHHAFIDCVGLKQVDLPSKFISTTPFIFARCNQLYEFSIHKESYLGMRLESGCVFKEGKFVFAEADVKLDQSITKTSTHNGVVFTDAGLRSIRYYNIQSDGLDELGIYNVEHPKDSVLRLSVYCKGCYFVSRPDHLKKIIIPFSNPDAVCFTKGRYYPFIFRINDLPSSMKKNIVLKVPKGCAETYENHPAFQGYKAIEEGNLFSRIVVFTDFFIGGIIRYFTSFKILILLTVLGLLLACCIIFLASYQAGNSKNGAKKSSFIVFALLFTIVAIPLIFIGFYWFFWIVVRIYNEVICTLIGVLACVVSIVILSAMGQMTFKGLWTNRRQLYLENKKVIIGFIKIAFILLLALYTYSLLRYEYNSKREEYVGKVHELYEKTNNKRILYKCLSKRTNAGNNLDDTYTPLDTLKARRNRVTSVAISHDGKRIVTGSWDDTAIIWDADNGTPLDTLKAHTSDVTSVAISHDGKRVVTGSSDNTAIICDAASGTPLDTLNAHRYSVNSVTISHDGKRIVTGSSDETAIIWDAASGTPLDTLNAHRYSVNSVAISHDGKRVVTGSSDNTAIIWDAASGTPLDTLNAHISNVTSVAISHDGKRVVTGSSDDTAIIWDAASGTPLDTLNAHRYIVNSVAISHDGKRIVTGSSDNTAIIWDAASGTPLDTLNAHRYSVNSVAISHDGKRIVTGSSDDTAIIWGNVPPALTESEQLAIYRLGFRYDKFYLWVILACILLLIMIVAVLFFPLHFKCIWKRSYKFVLTIVVVLVLFVGIRCIYIHIIVSRADAIEKVYESFEKKKYDACLQMIVKDISSKEVINNIKMQDIIRTVLTSKPMNAHSADVTSVAISHDGKRIVTGSWDDTAIIWDAASGTPLDTLNAHRYRVTSVAISRDDKRIVTGSMDDTAIIWDAASGTPLDTLKAHTSNVTSVAISHDGKRIVTGSMDDTAIIWDADNGTPLDTLKAHRFSVTSVAISHDGKRVVTGSSDNTAIIWDAASGTPLDTLNAHSADLTSVAISHDGKRIVTGSVDETAIIWDAESGTPLDTLNAHSADVTSVAISHDGKRIVTGSMDDTAIIWDADNGTPLDTLNAHSDDVTSVAISHDGKRIVTGSMDDSAIMWEIENLSFVAPKDLMKRAKRYYKESQKRNP